MEIARGKLVNQVSKAELPFSINPTEYQLNQTFDYSVDARLGKSAPLVTYRTGGPASLSFSVVFDRDAEEKVSLAKVGSFLKDLGKVDESTKSVPGVEFSMGNISFKGFVKSYGYKAFRFNKDAEPTGARLDMELVSDGSYEKGDA